MAKAADRSAPEPIPGAGPGPRRRLDRRWLAAVAAAALAGLTAWALRPRSRAEPARPPSMTVNEAGVALSADAPQWKYVELAVAQSGPRLAPPPAPGRVDFDEKRTDSIGAPLQGHVESVAVRLGDAVTPGARLFSVRSAAFAELDREVAQAEHALAVKQRIAERTRALVEIQAAPEKDAAAAEAEHKDAELVLRAAVAKRRSLEVGPGRDGLFWVRAPHGGTVVDLAVNPSQQVGPDREKPLARISNLDEVLILADLPEGDALDLGRGSPVRIRTAGGRVERAGAVDRVSAVVDPHRRTVEVRVRAQNRDRALRPNAFVEVALQQDAEAKVVKVPEEAVVTDGSNSYVFVARETGRLARQLVLTGRRRDGAVEIREGLEPGARFVARGALLLLNQIELAH